MDKIYYFGTALAVGAMMLLSGCGRQQAPKDFSFGYSWHEGSIPPPGYYQYSIEVKNDGSAQLLYTPDYPLTGPSAPPTWKHDFKITESQINEIYRLSIGRGLHKENWKYKIEKAGGAYSWLRLSVGGKDYEISDRANEDKKALELFAKIRDLVDQSVWNEMKMKKKAYDGNIDEDNGVTAN